MVRNLHLLLFLLPTGIFMAGCGQPQIQPPSSPLFSDQIIRDPHFKGKASLHPLVEQPGYRLRLQQNDKNSWKDLYIPDAVFRFEQADIDGDGSTDLLLGIYKRTHFETTPAKRLQILRIDAGHLRPLWLGSTLCQELVDFRPLSTGNTVRVLTLEKEVGGTYCNGLYAWQDFGLRLISYPNKKVDYTNAHHYFNHENNPG